MGGGAGDDDGGGSDGGDGDVGEGGGDDGEGGAGDAIGRAGGPFSQRTQFGSIRQRPCSSTKQSFRTAGKRRLDAYHELQLPPMRGSTSGCEESSM